jgi:S1-C subfamily serine protease
VVTEVDSEALTLDFNLRDAIADNAPGDVVTLTVIRAGESQQIEVTLGQPEQFGANEQG